MRKTKTELLSVYKAWVEGIQEEYLDSKYADYTVEDFYTDYKKSHGSDLFLKRDYHSLDHYSLLPTKKRVRQLESEALKKRRRQTVRLKHIKRRVKEFKKIRKQRRKKK